MEDNGFEWTRKEEKHYCQKSFPTVAKTKLDCEEMGDYSNNKNFPHWKRRIMLTENAQFYQPPMNGVRMKNESYLKRCETRGCGTGHNEVAGMFKLHVRWQKACCSKKSLCKLSDWKTFRKVGVDMQDALAVAVDMAQMLVIANGWKIELPYVVDRKIYERLSQKLVFR